MNLSEILKDKRMIFGITVVIAAVILLVTKVVTFDYLLENVEVIAPILASVYLWLENSMKSKEIKVLKTHNRNLESKLTLTKSVRKVDKI